MKINMVNDMSWTDHRSGWGYILKGLKKYQNETGILFDGCIDYTFGYGQMKKEVISRLPYSKSWVGFLHHPVNICPWYNEFNLSPSFTLNSNAFLDSSLSCKKIFTFSENLKEYVLTQVGTHIEVVNMIQPTETPKIKFNYEKFISDPKVIQIGTWMRELTTFFQINNFRYKKYMTLNKITLNYLKKEVLYYKIDQSILNSVTMLSHLDNNTYDKMLGESIVFLNLFDSSVNNTIIECVVRNTPVLVNKISPVVEYLGVDYPLYYENLNHAQLLLNDFARIQYTSNYLAKLNKEVFSRKFFIDMFKKHMIR